MDYERRASFAETDAMGVVHHSSYLLYCEEARVHWMRTHNLGHTHFPQASRVLALLEHRMWHLKPLFFEDVVRVQLQVRQEKIKVRFQYVIWKQQERIAEAETLHIVLDDQLKVMRPSPDLLQRLEKEPWIETWLSSLSASPKPLP